MLTTDRSVQVAVRVDVCLSVGCLSVGPMPDVRMPPPSLLARDSISWVLQHT